MRFTIKKLVVDGLGYCCEGAFFRCFTNTELIATRLGVSERAVRYRKELFREGKLPCEKCRKCMNERLKALGK